MCSGTRTSRRDVALPLASHRLSQTLVSLGQSLSVSTDATQLTLTHLMAPECVSRSRRVSGKSISRLRRSNRVLILNHTPPTIYNQLDKYLATNHLADDPAGLEVDLAIALETQGTQIGEKVPRSGCGSSRSHRFRELGMRNNLSVPSQAHDRTLPVLRLHGIQYRRSGFFSQAALLRRQLDPPTRHGTHTGRHHFSHSQYPCLLAKSRRSYCTDQILDLD